MVDTATLKRGCVGARIQVRDKTFQIVDVGEEGGRHFLLVECEGKRDKVDLEESKTRGLEGAYERLFTQPSAQQQQKPKVAKARIPKTGQVVGGLKKIKPELKFAYENEYQRKRIGEGFVMIGKAVNVSPDEFGITLENARQAYVDLERLEKEINKKNLSSFVKNKKLKLQESDAHVYNPYVSRGLDVLGVVEHALIVYKRLERAWKGNVDRIKKLIKEIKNDKSVRGTYYPARELSNEGFKSIESAQFFYNELLKLSDEKLKRILKIRARRRIREEANEVIEGYKKIDILWRRNWDLFASAIYLINRVLIPRINQAIAGQGQRGGRRQGRTPKATRQEPPPIEE